jgi:hypothetical protein
MIPKGYKDGKYQRLKDVPLFILHGKGHFANKRTWDS